MSKSLPPSGGTWPPRRDAAEWKRAVALIRSKILPEDRKAFREAMEEDMGAFVGAHHFSAGLTVRNLLRMNGFTPEALGAIHPDDAWVEVLHAAVAQDEDGKDLPTP